MSRFVIVTDSCSDLPLELVEKHHVHVIPMNVHIKHETFLNHPDQREITNQAFYARLRDKQVAKTSQINPEDFVREVEPLLKSGSDVLVVTISSSLSGSYNSMVLGRQDLLEKYPSRHISIVDSLNASLGEGFLVNQAILKQEQGLSLEETAKFLEELKLRVCSLFTVDELGTLLRGGRISFTKAFLGTLLNMKPALKIDENGKLVPWAKARGRKNAVAMMLDKMDEIIADDSVIFISHADSAEEAERVRQEVATRHPNAKTILVGEIGPVIGAHAGPGTLALFFIGKAR